MNILALFVWTLGDAVALVLGGIGLLIAAGFLIKEMTNRQNIAIGVAFAACAIASFLFGIYFTLHLL